MGLAALFGMLAAACNAFASVMQRHEARGRPDRESFRLALILQLVRRRLWWAGIGGVVGGAVCQALGLLFGRLAVVQPVLMVELPVTLLLAAAVFHRRPSRRALAGTLVMTGGIVVLLVAVDPSGGVPSAVATRWLVALPATVAAAAGLVVVGRRLRGPAEAALLGTAAAVSFALAAALMKDATSALRHGMLAFLTCWQLYATWVAGLAALYLLQNAYQAGTLVAAQPAITIGDALISLAYSVTLFDERLRMGWWLLPAAVGLAMIAAGTVELTRSPLIANTVDEAPAPRQHRPSAV